MISGIPPAPKGAIVFEDCFEIDAKGILTVTSKILSTGKTKKLTITNVNGRLSKEDIDKMAKDSKRYKIEDQKFKEKADAFNELEDCIYKIKNKINEYGFKKMVNPKSLKKIMKIKKARSNNQLAPAQ